MTITHFGPKPTQFNFARDVIDHWGQHQGESPALILVKEGKLGENVSYSELSARSIYVASGLYKLGLQPGDAIVISAGRCRDWYEVLCATIRSGIIVCPVASTLSGSDLQYRIAKVGAKAFIGDLAQVKKVMAVQTDLTTLQHMIQIGYDESLHGATQYSDLIAMGREDPEEITINSDANSPCVLYFTSGTTGQPKTVQHSQISLALSSKIGGEHWAQIPHKGLFWSLSEVGWVKGSWAVFAGWNRGAALLIDETPSAAFDPIRTLQILHEYPVTNFCGTPTAYRQLVTSSSKDYATKNPPRALKTCISAGENIESSVIEAWQNLTGGVAILNGYGLTETVFLSSETTEDKRPGSMGRPLPGVPLEILNDRKEPAIVGEEGAIAVCLSELKDSLYDIFSGYVNDDGSLTRPTVRGSQGKEYYLTGDRAHRDEEGYLWFKARNDDVINSSGYRIGPGEVEAALQSHEGVLESAVIGVADEERGSIIKAYVVLHEEFESRSPRKLQVELRQHCLNSSAPYKCPRVIEFISRSKLPRTVTGKVQRNVLRSWNETSKN